VSRWLDEIETLDPERDAQRIVFLDGSLEFPWDTERALELAFYRTYAVPSVAELLGATGETAQRPQKRYDDTRILIATFCECGYDSDLGRRAIRQMNRIHGRFEIANEDYLYVLSSLVFEPIRWNARFGWRPLIEAEKLATFYFWREVGRRMAIRDLPDSYDAFEQFNVDYERAHFARTDAGHTIAVATRDLRRDRAIVHALLDDRLLEALGLPRPAPWFRRFVEAGLRGRARIVRLLPSRRRPRLRTLDRHRSYPNGYELDALGPNESR
jgi:hypothetical protein